MTFETGIDLGVVEEWPGHSSLQVTEKYAHLLPTSLHMQQQCLNYDREPATFLPQVYAENKQNVANKCG